MFIFREAVEDRLAITLAENCKLKEAIEEKAVGFVE
jgi:hypothetical protein